MQAYPSLHKFLGFVLIILLSCSLTGCMQWLAPRVGNDEPLKEELPPGDDLPGASSGSANDPFASPVASGGNSSGSSLPLKPVGFRNNGTIALTVMPWTYFLPGSQTGAIPSNASTVAFPGGGNPSSHISLPLGTYTWCYWWELGDINRDSLIEYAHAFDTRPVLLDENDSDSTELAEVVTLAAPAGVGEYPGRCGVAPNPAPAVQTHPRPVGDILFSDDGSGAGGAQALFSGEYMAFSYQGGQGGLTANAPGVVLPAMYSGVTLVDFILTVEFTNFTASSESRYGIIFRSDDAAGGLASYYILTINPAAQSVELGIWHNQWSGSAAAPIPPGVDLSAFPVFLHLEVSGNEYRVFINGTFITSFVDGGIQSAGILGVSISTASTPETLTFDNLRVYSIR